jgi:putative membrane protein
MHLPVGSLRIQAQLLSLALVMLFGGLTACQRGDDSVKAARDEVASVSPEDQDFMGKAVDGHLSEIFMARIAMLKSANQDVKDYANMIEKDHSSALREMVNLMKQKRVMKPETLSDETREHVNRMNELTGSEFDREFVNMMVSGHEQAIEMYEGEKTVVRNPDVKEYIEGLLPKLELHLEKGLQLQSKLFSKPDKR